MVVVGQTVAARRLPGAGLRLLVETDFGDGLLVERLPVALAVFQGQQDGEGGSLAQSALHAHLALHGFDQLSHEGEAHAGAQIGALRLGLIERLEEVLEAFLGNTYAVVDHLDAQTVVPALAGDGDVAVLRGELRGVSDEVAHDFAQVVGHDVHHDLRLLGHEEHGDALGLGQLLSALDNHVEVGYDVARVPVGVAHFGLHLGDVEQLVDERE